MSRGGNMDYTRNEIIGKCNEAMSNVSTFYNQKFVNYRGRTTDTNEYYTEVIAEFVCDNIKEFEEIPTVTRQASYKTQGHGGDYSQQSNRLEEITAMQMFKQSQAGTAYDYIGKIIDYQVPLKNKKDDEVGKIDLLSVSYDTLYILELKKEDSTETMLRCILEGYTYLKTVDSDKLVNDFGLMGIHKVCSCPFVFREKNQWKEMQENRPQLMKLMKLMDSKPYYIKKIKDKFIITED